tara:strand:- start:2536 stop:5016 length:2481 start_codon:yes stop_codon:yes gene_type:complete
MSHSISNSYGTGRVYLVIDQKRTDMADANTRRVLVNLQDNIESLEWTYACSSGGFSTATAVAKVDRDTYVRRQIEAGNYSTAYIYFAPPETEGAVLISEYDSNESDFLMWMGVVSNVIVNPRTDDVTFEFQGLGDMASRGTADYESASISWSSIDTAEEWVTIFGSAIGLLNPWVIPTSLPTASKRIMSDGSMKRKLFYFEGRSTLDTHINNVADLLGGHPRVAWGLVNADGADDKGLFYFSLVADPMREQTSSDSEFNNRSCPRIMESEVISIDTSEDSSTVVNSARVFKPFDGSDGVWYNIPDGVAKNQISIDKYGHREQVVSDGSAKDQSQLAEQAGAIVSSQSQPNLSVNVSIQHDLRPTNYLGTDGVAYLPLVNALKSGTVKIPIPYNNGITQTQADRGACSTSVFEPETSAVASLKRDSTNGAVLGFDARNSPSANVPNAPVGLYSPCPYMYETGDMVASGMVWTWQMKWTDSAELGDGSGATKSCSLIEFDRQFYIALQAQGTTPQTYVPYLAYLSAGGTWTTAGSWTISYGTVITKAQLLAGISFVCSSYTAVTGNTDKALGFLLNAYIPSGSEDDPSGARTLIWAGSNAVNTITASGVMSTSGKRVVILNKMEGTGLSPLGASNFESLGRSVDIMNFTAYSTLGELNSAGNAHEIANLAIENFMPKLAYQDAPFAYQKYVVMDTQFGCTRAPEGGESFDTNAQAVIWTSFINRGSSAINTDGGFYGQLVSATSGTEMTTSSTSNLRKHNEWLIGNGDGGFGSVLGGSISLTPRVANFNWSGGKLNIDIEGNGRPVSATFKIKTQSEEIDTLLRNQRG